MKEKWVADFSRPEKSCFDIKPEISYNAYLEKGPSSEHALFLGLKRHNCMAWLETASRVYVNQVIEARFRFNGFGGYCAAGIMFRVIERGTYYLVLISNKGYFRLDAVNSSIPRPLIGWTEIPDINNGATSQEVQVNLGIITHDNHLIFTLNGTWIAEAYDDSIPGGHLGFAIVSYDVDHHHQSDQAAKEQYVCQTRLDYLSVDSRTHVVEAEYHKWINSLEISAKSRFRLAESLAALEHYDTAYDQILKTWKRRDEAVRSVMATYTEIRARGELLFATRIAWQLGQYTDAEEYINACLALDGDKAEGLDALAEKVNILTALNKHDEIIAFLPAYIKRVHAETDKAGLPSLYALLGHAYWNIHDYTNAAAAWDKAFRLNKNNGLYAVSAANAFEMTGQKTKALNRYLDGAKCFLQHENYVEMGALVPKMLAVGKNSKEAHTLAEKWACGIGDTELAKKYRVAADPKKSAGRVKKATLVQNKADPPKAPVKTPPGKTKKAADKKTETGTKKPESKAKPKPKPDSVGAKKPRAKTKI